nr:hypothetical protein GCM10020093_037760 [Planobispora longispora]
MDQHSDETDPGRRTRGLEITKQAAGRDADGGPGSGGDFFSMTIEHLFAEVWSRDGLSGRDRRLLLLGLLVGQGMDDALQVQLDAALRTAELTPASSGRSSSSSPTTRAGRAGPSSTGRSRI